MDGLLLMLADGRAAGPGRSFWKLFQPIRRDLDRLFWCFAWQPWMGAPDAFRQDEGATASFEGEERTSVMLWQPGSLGRYAGHFGEEFLELWAIEPTVDDPRHLAACYAAAGPAEMADVIERHARVWLLYTDGTCWEIYARKARLLEEMRNHLGGKPWVRVYESNAQGRPAAFRAAGLSAVWQAMNPGRR